MNNTLTDDEMKFLNDVQAVVDHVDDPTNPDTLEDLIALRGPIPDPGIYDDPIEEETDADWDTWQADLDVFNPDVTP